MTRDHETDQTGPISKRRSNASSGSSSKSRSRSVDKFDSVTGLESLVSFQSIKSALSVSASPSVPLGGMALSDFTPSNVSHKLSELAKEISGEWSDLFADDDEAEIPPTPPPSPPRLPSINREEGETLDGSFKYDDYHLKVPGEVKKSLSTSTKKSVSFSISPQPSGNARKKAQRKKAQAKKPTTGELMQELFKRTTRPIFTTRVIVVHSIHILIAIYFLMSCKADGSSNNSFPWHDMVCGRTEVGWGSDIVSFPSIDRFLHLDLGLFFILANVVPKYIKRDLAKRHQHNVVKRLRINPLLVHVIAGILTVLISGFVSWTQCYNRFTMTLVVLVDLAHQFSIYRLLKNHDGIWQLRVGNLALGIAKWICVLRIVVFGDFAGPTNVIFIHSMGFGLTRLFCTICAFVFTYVSKDLLDKEHWYSIGLSGAQFYCGYRNQNTYAPVFWLSLIMSSIFYYGKNLDRRYQSDLVYMSIIMCLVCKFMVPDWFQIPAIIVFYATGYWAPILTRTRHSQAPLTPTTPALHWKKGIISSLAKIAKS